MNCIQPGHMKHKSLSWYLECQQESAQESLFPPRITARCFLPSIAAFPSLAATGGGKEVALRKAPVLCSPHGPILPRSVRGWEEPRRTALCRENPPRGPPWRQRRLRQAACLHRSPSPAPLRCRRGAAEPASVRSAELRARTAGARGVRWESLPAARKSEPVACVALGA